MSATSFDPFSSFLSEAVTIIHNPTGFPRIEGPLSFVYTNEHDRGKSWKKLDIDHFPERLLQILSVRFNLFLHVKEDQPGTKKFLQCLNFIVTLQKMNNDDSVKVPAAGFRSALENLVALLKQRSVAFDECLPNFIAQSDLFLNKLADEGKTAVGKEDLFESHERDIASSGFTDNLYGDESLLIPRMGGRAILFNNSCKMIFSNLLVNCILSSKEVGDYIDSCQQIVKNLAAHISKKLLHFTRKRFQVLQNSRSRQFNHLREKAHKNMTKDFAEIELITSSFSTISNGKELREKYRVLLGHSEYLKNTTLRLIEMGEELLDECRAQFNEASALLLFILSNFQPDSSSIKSPEAAFKDFLDTFSQKETSLRSSLFQFPADKRQLFLKPYLNSETLRMQKLKMLSQRLELIELFGSSLDFMEETLRMYHQSHRYFLDRRETAIAQHKFADDLRRHSIVKTTQRSIQPPAIEQTVEIETVTRPSSSESSYSMSTLEATLHFAINQTKNKQARAALFNATTLLDDLFVELETVLIRSIPQRIEHLDNLLVNLSVFFEQMLSFMALERVNPKSREEARPYLLHNLLSLIKTLSDEMRTEVTPLATDLNGVENYSRFVKKSTSTARAIHYLSAVHSLSEDTESSISSSDALHKEIYLFVKEELESIFRILLQKDICTIAWEERWTRIISKTTTPSSSSFEGTHTPAQEEQFILDNIDRLITTCQSFRHPSVWITNAQRLLNQLKARVSLTKNISDFSAAHKRSAGLMCLIAWSLCIASADKKKLINIKQSHPSNFSKNLWTWVELILGDEEADEMTSGEKRFCNLSRSVYFQNRYQHNSKDADFPLWRIGCDSREEELAFISSSSTNRDLVTLQDGLMFIERILA